MITGLRSAIVCDQVEQTEEHGTTLIGLRGELLYAGSRPGLIEGWLVLQVETDGQASLGQITVSAKNYAPPPTPFNPPQGVRLTAAAFPILIPLLEPGMLVVTISDAGRRLKPLQVRWRLDFLLNAQRLAEGAAGEMIEASHRHIAAVFPGLQAYAAGGRRPS